jgi:hypothetical protein
MDIPYLYNRPRIFLTNSLRLCAENVTHHRFYLTFAEFLSVKGQSWLRHIASNANANEFFARLRRARESQEKKKAPRAKG